MEPEAISYINVRYLALNDMNKSSKKSKSAKAIRSAQLYRQRKADIELWSSHSFLSGEDFYKWKRATQ